MFAIREITTLNHAVFTWAMSISFICRQTRATRKIPTLTLLAIVRIVTYQLLYRFAILVDDLPLPVVRVGVEFIASNSKNIKSMC